MNVYIYTYTSICASYHSNQSIYLPIYNSYIPYHIISYHIISYHIISYHIISYHIISYHIISYHIISYHIISYHFVSYHFLSFYITRYHITSCQIITYIYIYISLSLSLSLLPYVFYVGAWAHRSAPNCGGGAWPARSPWGRRRGRPSSRLPGLLGPREASKPWGLTSDPPFFKKKEVKLLV